MFTSKKLLKFTDEERILNIKALDEQMLINNGTDNINDHSSYLNTRRRLVPLGYITHSKFKKNFIEDFMFGGKKRTTRKNR
jgi:hypothetical protein